MTNTVGVYHYGTLISTGVHTGYTISSISKIAERVFNPGMHVQVTSTDGNNIGATMQTRVLTDSDTSITVQDATPFS